MLINGLGFAVDWRFAVDLKIWPWLGLGTVALALEIWP